MEGFENPTPPSPVSPLYQYPERPNYNMNCNIIAAIFDTIIIIHVLALKMDSFIIDLFIFTNQKYSTLGKFCIARPTFQITCDIKKKLCWYKSVLK